ncbi:MAG: hypothetical protein AAF236_17545, partial [Verrucomicrobiota bacterium]
MKTASDQYQQIAKSALAMSSLWKGAGQLILVSGSGFLFPFREDYKRFRFTDVQVISVAKRSRSMMCFVYGAGILIFLLPFLLVITAGGGAPFGLTRAVAASVLAVIILIFLGLLIRHIILGPTCVCEIQTSLSRDRLSPLNRYHRTLEVIDSLHPEIEASQTELLATGTLAGGDAASAIEERKPLSVSPLVVPTFSVVFLFGLG